VERNPRVNDEDYCCFCGSWGEEARIHCCDVHQNSNIPSYVCETCCKHLWEEYEEHVQTYGSDACGYYEWLRLVVPERVILVDWSEEDYELIETAARLTGQTVEEYIRDSLQKYVDERGTP
jgi:hypothetical protein